MLTSDQILEIFRKTGALLSGHFLLSSGLHSPTYFQCARVLQYPQYAQQLCAQLAGEFQGKEIDLVIAPAIGGIVVACEVGKALNARAIFAERENGRMTLRRGFEISRGEKALVVEDVITTGGSVEEVIEVVRENRGKVAGVGCLVDRSGGKARFDVPFAALVQMEAVTYQPELCPLCAKGIELTKPGSRKIHLPLKEQKPTPSYRYRAVVNRVVDGDTLDVTLDLGFYVALRERLRLEGIDAPEIFRVPKVSDEYKKGMETKSYVEKRLAENNGEMIVETRKRGKWRRWLAKVYLEDSEKTLNEELVDQGLAEPSEH